MCRKVFLRISIIAVLIFSGVNLIQAQQEVNKRDYYSEKIAKNEVGYLETKLADQEKEFAAKLKELELNYAATIERQKTSIDNLTALVAQLEKNLEEANKKVITQKADYEKTLIEKNQELQIGENRWKDQVETQVSQEKKAYSDKLLEKYQQLEQVLKDNELKSAQSLTEKQSEIEQLKKESFSGEKNLRELMAQKELSLIQGFEKEKKTLIEKTEAMQKSQDQLRLYLVKLKEEAQLREDTLKSREDQIQILNKKLALYAGEEDYEEKKLGDVLREDLKTIKKENERLGAEITRLKTESDKQKENYEWKLAKANKALDAWEGRNESDLNKSAQLYEKKMKIAEAGFQQQLEQLKAERVQENEVYEAKLKQISLLLEEKIKEENKLKENLGNFRNTQLSVLEDVLTTKAEMMHKTTPAQPSTEQDKKLKEYFDRAMAAINEKNYSRAKYELEQVLAIDKNNQFAANMLSNVDFLIKKKR